MPDRVTWASTIGLFIINSGALDWQVQGYLESQLSPEEFGRIKGFHFRDRIERLRLHVQQGELPAPKREQFEQWAARLKPIREMRNHIAHGLLRLSLAEDKKTYLMTLSLPRDLDGSNAPSARHLTLEELLNASAELSNLTEAFKTWDGSWVTDFDVKF